MASSLPRLEDLPEVRGRHVLVRVDFNVPLEEDPASPGARRVADDFRIRAALPTLRWLVERGAHVTACSHLGRPKGAPDPRFDMAPVRAHLETLVPGVQLLENLRFSPGETANDPAFVDQLVAGQDAYVNEAFGASHRAHASIVGPPARLPSAAGRQLAREVEVIGGLLESPAHPFVAVVGGAKVADKLGVLEVLAKKVDVLCVGGAMAFTFLVATGHSVGDSLVDPEHVESCAKLLASGVEIVLPVDTVALESGAPFGAGAGGGPRAGESSGGGPSGGGSSGGEVRVVDQDVPDGWRGLDIGPKTAAAFGEVVADAATVFWNGPLGVTEDDRFASGTRKVAQAVATSRGFSVVGGGDIVSALDHLGLADRVDFLSTGGGASLELLEKGDLPGLAALRNAPNAPHAPHP
ncbi:MAG: phosphoglycerate kinase [Actinomycetota bacterium]|nr:phosphoglycerate kinase [Actinomycetota bacterium]